MDIQSDTENYWNRSSSKAFSFDDDDKEKETEYRFKWDGSVLVDDVVSEASFGNKANALNLSVKSIISEECLKLILDEQTFESQIFPKGVSVEEELKLLRRKLQNIILIPSLKTTAYKLLLGKHCPLEIYKSLKDKEHLLDTVFENGGGDSVVGVILFLNKTLNRDQFYQIIRDRPKAVEHYVNYLVKIRNLDSIEILTMVGKFDEATMFQYKSINEQNDLCLKRKKIKHFLETQIADRGVISIYNQIFNSSFDLLKLLESESIKFDNSIDVESSPVEVLYTCCRLHKNWTEQDLLNPISPFKFCNDYHISVPQFEWTVFNERSITQSYMDLTKIFEKSSWHSIKQKQFQISFSLETAIIRLAELNAPTSVLYLFLSKLSNPSIKLELSQKVKCWKGIIDGLAALKDANQLFLLKKSLPSGSEENYYCEQALQNLNKRWSKDAINIKL